MGTSQPTEDPTGDINPEGKTSGIFERSVAERTSRRGVETRRDPLPFDTGDKRKDPESIQWKKCGQ